MINRILPVFALFVAIGIFFAYISPTWTGSIAATKTAIASDDQALIAASDYTKQQNELASARNAIDPADLARITAFLPDSVDNVGLILNLNALAARSGLSISNIDVIANAPAAASETLTASKVSPISSVDLSLSAIGTYSALQAFLIGVEKSERLLDVRDITVTGSDTGVYKYKMTLRLYWLH
ncbi:MAG: type 4a pilus biogenesis protein PilO [Candidatus Kaiserbacteria bacterium]|nr:type 4a pilus biogenesis protein PilO [Candidatus Kaiserbacteria bacterium]